MLPPPLFMVSKYLYCRYIKFSYFLISYKTARGVEKHRETFYTINLVVRALLSTFGAANQNPI